MQMHQLVKAVTAMPAHDTAYELYLPVAPTEVTELRQLQNI
jgi:hypothetical protein